MTDENTMVHEADITITTNDNTCTVRCRTCGWMNILTYGTPVAKLYAIQGAQADAAGHREEAATGRRTGWVPANAMSDDDWHRLAVKNGLR